MTLDRLSDSFVTDGASTSALLRSALLLTDEAIRQVRTVSYVMYPPMLSEAGVAPALRWYLRGFAARSSIRTSAEIPEDFGRCSTEIETAIFCIVQEALTNVHRHSGSPTVTVTLQRVSGGIVIAEVIDSGCGTGRVSDSKVGTAPGVGIAGMKERAQLLGGRLEIESALSVGTTVRAILPATSSNDLRVLSMTRKEVENAEGSTGQLRRIAAAF